MVVLRGGVGLIIYLYKTRQGHSLTELVSVPSRRLTLITIFYFLFTSNPKNNCQSFALKLRRTTKIKVLQYHLLFNYFL